MLNATTRHHLLQKLFWNPVGASIARRFIRFSRKFDVVVRNYSLNGETNGERWLATLMDDAPLAIDVGFHDGASTAEILKARPKARVIGFDPSRFALGCYDKDFKSDERITFVNQGLAAEPGELEFYDYDNMCNSLAKRKEMPGEKPRTYKVPITTLDQWCADNAVDRVNFMKVDAEGYDLHVLEGATRLLGEQAIDIFMFEFASGWTGSKRYLWEVTEYFEDKPYKLYHLFNGFLTPLKYDVHIDSCTTMFAMYVGVSDERMARGDIPVRDYGL
ncbi:MAG: FkbM family methyltransferase [Sphingomonas sp.]|uniref:FkbM family methyltransferase n=1 Tax=Sphingomonas sp. TaxID=28214 RepID=UPI00121D2BBB|nr:FkbM family methyltransferase [Sphingomonas sp.]THD37163.1 MAG: FkbM family methyltransferase [Sphingomonas sp.]